MLRENGRYQLAEGDRVIEAGGAQGRGPVLKPLGLEVLQELAPDLVRRSSSSAREKGPERSSGWSGYVIDPMQARRNALEASILLGLVWAAWHWVPLLQAHRSPAWIAWWSLYTVALRVLIVWLYNNAGKSVFAVGLFHAFTNVSGITFSDYYDPRITGLIVAFAAAIVTAVWGPRTLARHRNGCAPQRSARHPLSGKEAREPKRCGVAAPTRSARSSIGPSL